MPTMREFATTHLPCDPTEWAPDGSAVRVLLGLDGGTLAHFEMRAGQTSRCVVHDSVEEIWFVQSGRGELWRKQAEREAVVSLSPGVCVTIPRGTHFQFRALPAESLAIVAVTMPPWPGEREAALVPGPWAASPGSATDVDTVSPPLAIEPIIDAPFVDCARREIDDLQRFLQGWYRGTETRDIGRVARALASEFELLAPTGDVISRDQLLTELVAERGAHPALTITIEHVGVRKAEEGATSIEYVERHIERGATDTRLCCALLRRDSKQSHMMELVAIHERTHQT
jgi:mannose-6-phosphate isomerase-like protein (cupin superfamily)